MVAALSLELDSAVNGDMTLFGISRDCCIDFLVIHRSSLDQAIAPALMST